MYRLFFIAKNNMKKQKGDMITFFVMTFLSAFMIFTCVNLLTGTFRVLDTNKEAINGADIFILAGEDDMLEYKLKEYFQGEEDYGAYEQNKCIMGMSKWRKVGNKWADYSFCFASYDEERTIQTASIDTSGLSGNYIVLPASLSTSVKVGDRFEIKINDNMYDFRVAGFNEDLIFCSPMNMATYLSYISEQKYQQIEFENQGFMTKYNVIKVQFTPEAATRLSGNDESERISDELISWSKTYNSMHPDQKLDFNISFVPSDMMAIADMILPFIFIAIILVFALVIMVVALVVIDFSVKNFITDNMKNTGIMEAGGYTVKEMVMILVVQLLSVSFAGSFTGTLLAALLQGKIGIIMLFLLGLSWNQSADPVVFAGVVLGTCLIVAIFTLFLGREYKKTTVLEALRGGITTHNFTKNVFPFDKSSLPIPIILALKETFGKIRAQIGVIGMMAVLAFSAAMGIGIYENMGKDVDTLLVLSGIDLHDADFSGDINMGEVVKGFECVDEMHYEIWTAIDFKKGKKSKVLTSRVISDTSLMNPDQMVEGRWPLYENEAALGTSAADTLGVKVGDTITLRVGDEEASYLVTGLLQTFNNMGMMGYVSEEGYKRIANMPTTVSYTVDLKPGYTFADLEKEFSSVYPDVELTDELASTGGLFPMLKTSMSLIMIIIMLITGFIVALAEGLLIRTRITKEWRNLGVYKALGFTSNQLITQIMISNIPAIIIGIILGLVGVTFLGDKLIILMFAIFGFKKVHFVLSPIEYICVIILIMGVALIVSRACGSKIKKLEPVKMITEE